MSEVTVHACSTQCNPDLLDEQEVRAELKRANGELFAKDLLIIELKQQAGALDRILISLARLQLAGNYSALRSEIQRLAAHYQQQQAAQRAARQVH
ncbi:MULTISPECIES: hypothetical protein [unclassified Pseudomonas]|uniref:hypothetical protein n=1 Tax=unclassified Pseudomonas TaxID=196821 RepID=UPI00083895C2|nr:MULTISPECIES: hypothetical protein [unclassified Pseudomonas]QIH08949.1 hypothetical protein ATY02_20530 [Pseudomonas sp. BIOMIG1BAC]